MEIDSGNKFFHLAADYINNTDRHVFITGKAGSGKTTFLKHIRQNTFKKIAITAPTGIAALNAEGVTLHSLLNLPVTPFIPGSISRRINVDSQKRVLVKALDTLIIDEVSMLRSDVLDAADALLREVRNNQNIPFGGLQVIYIGDLYQLPPIITPSDWEVLCNYYSSPYFTAAKVIQATTPVIIEFDTIYRQKDQIFVSLLNSVRKGTCSAPQINQLNTRFQKLTTDLECVTITTHNDIADRINETKLRGLETEEHSIAAEIIGTFDETAYPTEKLLRIKEGARIMMIRNDKKKEQKYYNGKSGIIEKIELDSLFIRFENNEVVRIEKNIWQNIKYDYDSTKGKISHQVIGSFSQFPIRLGWAITVHKSQGLTFDQAIVDLANVFVPGQAYVALSRVRSFDGLILHSQVTADSLNGRIHSISPNLEEFNIDILDRLLADAKADFLAKTLHRLFDWSDFDLYLKENANAFVKQELLLQLKNFVLSNQKVSVRFNEEIKFYCSSLAHQKLNERIITATGYFVNQMNASLIPEVESEYNRTKNSINQKISFRFFQGVLKLIKQKKEAFELAQRVTAGAVDGKSLFEVLNSGNPVKKKSPKNITEIKTPIDSVSNRILNMFKNGDDIDQIATSLKMGIPAIENYLTGFLASKQIDILDLMDIKTFESILQVIKTPSLSLLATKRKLGNNVTFGQIKAVKTYLLHNPL